MRSQWIEVARREITTRGRTKAFRIVTAFIALAAIAGPVVAALWPESDGALRDVQLAVSVDVDNAFIDRLDVLVEGRLNVSIDTVNDPSELERVVASGSADVAVLSGPELFWRRNVDTELDALIRVALNQAETLERAQQAGIDEQTLTSVLTPTQVPERFSNPSDTTNNFRDAITFAGLLIAFMVPQVFGQLTLMSVVEEKSTRVIEVLLSHIRPSSLLAGKVAGIVVLALIQVGLLIGGLFAGLALTSAVSVPSSVWQFIPILGVGLVSGLLIYTTLFALFGSLISRMEDASQVIMPLYIPLFVGYFVGQSAIIGSANSLLPRILTFVPLTAPMLLPVRVIQGGIAPWEVAVSILLMAACVVGLLRLAGRVYEVTLLRTGSRISWRDLFSSMRAAN